MTDFHTVYLGLGSNLGRRRYTLQRACQLIECSVGPIERRSHLLETEPFGFQSAHKFLNGVIRVKTRLTPRQLLIATQAIERQLGRTLKSLAHIYHDRTIDIDILLYDSLTIDEPDLHIPHPEMRKRDFVMIPLHEVMKEELSK